MGAARRGFVLLLGALVLVSATLAQPARRAVLLSFDALGGERLGRLLEEPGRLPAGAFRRIAERGFFAVRSVPPTPALTAVAHVTHVTGALPRETGIVSNSMLDRGKPFGATVSGFDAPIRAETLWQAARRQGKRVGVVLYPGATGTAPERSGDWGMTWPGRALVRARLHALPASAWREAASGPDPSHSPPRRVTISFPETRHAVAFVALDTTDDGAVAYDRLRVESEAGPSRSVGPGEWFPVEVRAAEGRTGAWCKLLSLAPDLAKTEIYVGGLYRNAAYPDEFRRTLDDRLGFWPGPPDDAVFGSRSPRAHVFLEQAERLADFLNRAALLAIARDDWDLLLIYRPEVDEIAHEFLLADAAQRGYTAERAARFRAIVDGAFALADRSLDAIEKALSRDDAIFVTSDHGMTPVWDAIYPNEILRQAGLLDLAADGSVSPESAAVAVTDGAIAHVYVNPRAPEGTLEKVEGVLAALRVRGESPWDRLVRRRQASPLGLDAPESGDLILLGKPGAVLRRGAGEGTPIVGQPADFGAHGYRGAYRQLHATFLAAGPGIARGRADEISSTEIAARVSRALGIEPPRDAARP